MRKLRMLKATIDHFDTLLQKSDLEPEQRQAIETCRKRVKELGRMKVFTKVDVFCCVREIAEKFLMAFHRK